jgi:hypothetical protein
MNRQNTQLKLASEEVLPLYKTGSSQLPELEKAMGRLLSNATPTGLTEERQTVPSIWLRRSLTKFRRQLCLHI